MSKETTAKIIAAIVFLVIGFVGWMIVKIMNSAALSPGQSFAIVVSLFVVVILVGFVSYHWLGSKEDNEA